MKNLLLLLTLVILFGCKKDYTCRCNAPGDPQNYDTKIYKAKKADAQVQCDKIKGNGWESCKLY